MIEVAGGLLYRESKVLLGLRAPYKRVCPDCWDAIGGHVEPGETSEEALIRELREEIGVTPTVHRRLAAFTYREPEGEVRYVMHRVDAWAGEPALCNDEHVALAWFSLDEARALPNLADPRYRETFNLLRS